MTKILISLLFGGTMILSAPAFAQTFNLCTGENYESNKNRCFSYEAYAECYQEKDKARDLCQQAGSSAEPTVIKLRSVGGGRCGYTNWRVVCN